MAACMQLRDTASEKEGAWNLHSRIAEAACDRFRRGQLQGSHDTSPYHAEIARYPGKLDA